LADIYSKQKRKELMSKISGKETKPEVIIRKHLFSKGFRYRKNVKNLSGKPDVVLAKYKTAIFIHGCFWHGHTGCVRAKLPKTRRTFWKEKIYKNIERDKQNCIDLQKIGWNVITIWQCQLKNKQQRMNLFDNLVFKIKVNMIN